LKEGRWVISQMEGLGREGQMYQRMHFNAQVSEISLSLQINSERVLRKAEDGN
jgi:hypothetical protein